MTIEPDDSEEEHANALMRYGRALVWRMGCELIRRYPGSLAVEEHRVHTGQVRGISIVNTKAHRSLFFHVPNPSGSMGMIGYLEPDEAYGPEGEFAWQPKIGEFSRAADSRTVLNDLGKQLKLGPRKGIPKTTPYSLTWRVIAAFMTQVITGRTNWDFVSGICFDSYYGDTAREALLAAYPEAAAAAQPLHGSLDRRARLWFLIEDPDGWTGDSDLTTARACLVPELGQAWFPNGEGHDLYAIFEKADRRVWPTLGTALGHFIE